MHLENLIFSNWILRIKYKYIYCFHWIDLIHNLIDLNGTRERTHPSSSAKRRFGNRIDTWGRYDYHCRFYGFVSYFSRQSQPWFYSRRFYMCKTWTTWLVVMLQARSLHSRLLWFTRTRCLSSVASEAHKTIANCSQLFIGNEFVAAEDAAVMSVLSPIDGVS